ncbi:hypothetical protein A6U98_02075 [Rhizobium sp. WYCCWR10014]|nr:hypothetical protein A6U98_02075 [Rhizobium sp. WYCCWR10014]
MKRRDPIKPLAFEDIVDRKSDVLGAPIRIFHFPNECGQFLIDNVAKLIIMVGTLIWHFTQPFKLI